MPDPPRKAPLVRLETITNPADYSPHQLEYAAAFMRTLATQAHRGRLVLCEPPDRRTRDPLED